MNEPSSDTNAADRPRTAVITCAVVEAEVRHFTLGLEHMVHIEVLQQGLHQEPDKLRIALQEAVDRVENMPGPAAAGPLEAIVLGYGLCSRGIEGVRSKRCKLVVARAHDCITLLLGDKDRYADYVKAHPGTYWYSPGWNRHHTPPGPQRHKKLHAEYSEKYGEDNADYLMEVEQSWMKHYDRATFVDLSIGTTDRDVAHTKDCARWLGWSFDRQPGDPALIKALLAGLWDEQRFLVLEPGQTIRMTADERVIEPVDADQHDPTGDKGGGAGVRFQP